MERLYSVLSKCCPMVDFRNERELITMGVIDSVELAMIIVGIEEEFGISIDMDNIDPENFNSAELIWKLIGGVKE